MATAAAKREKYESEEHVDTNVAAGGGGSTSVVPVVDADGARDLASHKLFEKGQSRRIWGELYKVLDCSDVVVQVLDARDPLGTRRYTPQCQQAPHRRTGHSYFFLTHTSPPTVLKWRPT